MHPNVATILAIAAIVCVVLSYYPGVPLLPVGLFLVALAIIVIKAA